MTEKARKNFEWLYRGFVMLLLAGLVTMVFAFTPKAIDAINNRTFDSPEQKVMVIGSASEEIITESEKDRMLEHMDDSNMHMKFEEKATIIRIEENQKRIGQDLQEIKNLLRQE